MDKLSEHEKQEIEYVLGNEKTDKDIDKTYSMPKSRITYRKPRRISEEQREASRRRIENINNRK